jgi:TM2 domain-containing membrane protein YozV
VDAVAKEQWALAILTARFDCAQQKFFQAEYGRRRRSPAVALALCLTLGAFGAHEFYLGRLRSATLRLLFCWTLIPLALALIEASFLTQRVHTYNTRMAHTLAEIVEETFAAVREQSVAAEQPPVAARPAPQAAQAPFAWRVGVARTFAAPAGTRWRQETPPTVPLAEERIVPVTEPQTAIVAALPVAATLAPRLRAAPTTHPLPAPFNPQAPTTDAWRIAPTEPLDAPVFTTTAPLSRRERAQLGPSLDALLADLTQLADDTEAQRADQPAATPAAPTLAAIEESAPPTPLLDTAPVDPMPVDTAPTNHPANESDSLDLQPPAPVAPPAEDYAKMMATDEPPAAIMGAEPASVPVMVAVAATPPRVQRIIVRKVAMVDGQIVAEAKASRDVVIGDADAEARIAAATDEARDEAMRLLATLVPAETLAQAHGA